MRARRNSENPTPHKTVAAAIGAVAFETSPTKRELQRRDSFKEEARSQKQKIRKDSMQVFSNISRGSKSSFKERMAALKIGGNSTTHQV